MVIKSSYDTEYYAEIDNVYDAVKFTVELDRAYLKGFDSGEYLHFKNNCDMVMYHECLESDVKNLITEESLKYICFPLDVNILFDIRNDIRYWMDILTKSGDIKTFEVNVSSSDEDGSVDINVIYTDNDDNGHSVVSKVFTGAFN